MAILSGSYKNISIALIVSASFAGYAIAATTSTKTQPSKETYNVNEKDLPLAETIPNPNDIPPPDFKEFQNDKFINNLLGEDNKVSTDTPKADAKSDAAAKDAAPTAAPDVIIDKLLSGDESAEPKKEETATQTPQEEAPKADAVATDKSVAPVSTETATPKTEDPLVASPAPVNTPETATDAQAETAPATTIAEPANVTPVENEQTVTAPLSPEEEADQELNSKPSPAIAGPAVNPENPGTAAESANTETATQKENSAQQPQPEALTEADLQTYAELKRHLVNFVTKFQAANEEKIKIAASEAKEQEVENKDPTPAEEEVKTEAPDISASPPSPDESATPAVEIEQKPVEAVAQESITAEVKKPTAIDELSELLEPDSSATKQAQPEIKSPDAGNHAVAVNAPAAPVEAPKTPVEAENNAAAPVAQVTAETPAAPAAENTNISPPPVELEKTTDTVEELTPQEPQAVQLEEPEMQQLAIHEKPSEADKAYFKLLDKRREKLPESQRLSDTTREAMGELSTTLAPLKKTANKSPQYITIERGNTSEPGIEENGVMKSQSKIDVSVRNVGSNEVVEKTKVKLEKAYKALLVGQTAAAINIYKEVLDREPSSRDAMFGLATAYHKNNQFEQARAIYTDILRVDPSNKEALNNFLVLVAEEAPEDALIELEKLERINSDFSPIAAQIAMINLKLGNPEKAARYLRRAILLSPENISYKYNLAITYDKLGKDEQAVQLYRQIINAVRGGAIISGSIDKVIERTTYLEKKIGSNQ